MTDTGEWQGRVGDSWAAEWRRTDRSFAQLTERLLAETRKFEFSRVIDIGCGAGELALAIARGRPQVRITGIDVSSALVAVASERGSHIGNADFVEADAAKWQAEVGNAPELLVSRHGVMFFEEPAQAFANLAEQCAPGAALLFSCFRDRAQNPFFTEVTRLLAEPPETGDPHAPGPFAFADLDRIRAILSEGGWGGIQIRPFDFAMIAGAGGDAVEDAADYWTRIGPAARPASQMDLAARERFLDRIRSLAQRHCRDGIVALPAAAWIVTATRS